MRLDAREHSCRGWLVWHAEQCRELKHVVWVDDESARYGQHVIPLRVIGGEILIEPHQAKRIDIIQGSRLIVINQVEDGDESSMLTGTGVETPRGVVSNSP